MNVRVHFPCRRNTFALLAPKPFPTLLHILMRVSPPSRQVHLSCQRTYNFSRWERMNDDGLALLQSASQEWALLVFWNEFFYFQKIVFLVFFLVKLRPLACARAGWKAQSAEEALGLWSAISPRCLLSPLSHFLNTWAGWVRFCLLSIYPEEFRVTFQDCADRVKVMQGFV